jgi:hypothetical protein
MIEIIDPNTMQPFPSVLQGTTRCFGLPFDSTFAVRCNAPGTHYGRVEYVISVDGRDTQTNQPSSPSLSGVVSDRAYTCPGFQVGPNGACSFVFKPKGTNATTAERNGTADLCGVAVVAMYSELVPTRMRREPMSYGPSPEVSMYKLAGGSLLATRGSGGAAAGPEVTHRLSETPWARGVLIGQEVAEYDTIENWARRGVFIPQIRSGSPWGAPETRFAPKDSL